MFGVNGIEAFYNDHPIETKQSDEDQFELGFAIVDYSVVTGIGRKKV